MVPGIVLFISADLRGFFQCSTVRSHGQSIFPRLRDRCLLSDDFASLQSFRWYERPPHSQTFLETPLPVILHHPLSPPRMHAQRLPACIYVNHALQSFLENEPPIRGGLRAKLLKMAGVKELEMREAVTELVEQSARFVGVKVDKPTAKVVVT